MRGSLLPFGEKIAVSNVVPDLKGMGITFIMSGLMSMAFMGFTGIKLADPSLPATGPEQPFPLNDTAMVSEFQLKGIVVDTP